MVLYFRLPAAFVSWNLIKHKDKFRFSLLLQQYHKELLKAKVYPTFLSCQLQLQLLK